jgi:hypothetical protein
LFGYIWARISSHMNKIQSSSHVVTTPSWSQSASTTMYTSLTFQPPST